MDNIEPPPVDPSMREYDATRSPYRMGGTVDARYQHPTYLLKRQVWKLVGGALRLYGPDETIQFYVERKAFKLKDDIRIYADETKTTELMSVNARQLLDFLGTFDVADSAKGQPIGTLQRKNVVSTIRDEWHILDPAGNQTGRVLEDSLALALVRDFLFAFLPRSFHVEHLGVNVGKFSRKPTFLGYTMVIELYPTAPADFDRRLAIAAAVLIAFIEASRRRG